MSNITFRSANLYDKAAVLNILKDGFDGTDYIETYYDSFVKMENSFPYVAVVDRNIVGFCVAFLVDDMKTLIPRAGRVSPEHTGKGIFKQLIKHIKNTHRRDGMKYRFTTVHENQTSYSRTFRKEYDLIFTKEPTCFMEIERIIDTSREHHGVTKASDTDLEIYFSSKDYIDYLFPDGIVMVNWVPYSPNKSNISIIRSSGRVEILSDVRKGKGGLKGILSFATVYQCSHDSSCSYIDIYGDNATSFELHITQQLRNLFENMPETISIYTYGDITVDQIQDTGKAIGLVETITNSFDKMYFYESDL